MGIVYKLDILKVLKEAGWTTYRIEKEKALSATTLQRIRRGEMISLDNLGRICKLLSLQPGDIIRYEPEDE